MAAEAAQRQGGCRRPAGGSCQRHQQLLLLQLQRRGGGRTSQSSQRAWFAKPASGRPEVAAISCSYFQIQRRGAGRLSRWRESVKHIANHVLRIRLAPLCLASVTMPTGWDQASADVPWVLCSRRLLLQRAAQMSAAGENKRRQLGFGRQACTASCPTLAEQEMNQAHHALHHASVWLTRNGLQHWRRCCTICRATKCASSWLAIRCKSSCTPGWCTCFEAPGTPSTTGYTRQASLASLLTRCRDLCTAECRPAHTDAACTLPALLPLHRLHLKEFGRLSCRATARTDRIVALKYRWRATLCAAPPTATSLRPGTSQPHSCRVFNRNERNQTRPLSPAHERSLWR